MSTNHMNLFSMEKLMFDMRLEAGSCSSRKNFPGEKVFELQRTAMGRQ